MKKNFVEEIVDDCKTLMKYKYTTIFLLVLPLIVVLFLANLSLQMHKFTPSIAVYEEMNANATVQNNSSILNNFYTDFTVVEYSANVSCINTIIVGKHDVCIIIPLKLQNIQELQIYLTLDNFEQIKPFLQTYTLSLGSNGKDTKTEVTVNLLTKLGGLKDQLSNQSANLNAIESELTLAQSKIDELKQELSKVDIKFSVTDFNADDVNKKSVSVSNEVNTLKKKGKKAVDTAKSSFSDIEKKVNDLNVSSAEKDAIKKIINSTDADLSSLATEIDADFENANKDISYVVNSTDKIKSSLSDLNNKVVSSMQGKQSSSSAVGSIASSINSTLGAVAMVDSYFAQLNANLPTIKANAQSENTLVATMFNKVVSNKIAYELIIIFSFVILFMTLFVSSLLLKIKLAEENESFMRMFFNVLVTVFIINCVTAIILTIIYGMVINWSFIFVFHLYIVLILVFTVLFTLFGCLVAALTHTEETNAMAVFSLLSLFILFSDMIFEKYHLFTQYNPLQLFTDKTANTLLLLQPFLSSDLIIVAIYIIFFFLIVILLSGTKYILKHPQVSFSYEAEHHHTTHKSENNGVKNSKEDDDVLDELENIGKEEEKEHHYAKTEELSVEDFTKIKSIAKNSKENEKNIEKEEEKKIVRVPLQEEKKQKRFKGAGDDIVEKLSIEGEVHELLRKNKKLTKKEIRKVLIEEYDESAVDDVLKELFK
ncbi:hypothetical protein HZA96_04775 [Candidatus Woesearchaeota archaeon]|nr:hypothetical protein [Candidatus Woesearchaeota archaeon]